MKKQAYWMMAALLLTSFFIQGCGEDNPQSTGASSRSYDITVVNLSSNQPLSPIAAIMHGPGYQGMTLGSPASLGLEQLAESGDHSAFILEAKASGAVSDTVSGTNVITPGAQTTLTLTGDEQLFTLVSMLVNTNDAIAAVNVIHLDQMAKNETMTLFVRAYDAGTEGNSETAGEVPGPAGNGEGFNSARNDRNVVSLHPGVISQDDGLPASALDQSHRFDQPVAKILIKRVS